MKLGKKSSQLNPGCVYAPYIMMSSSSIIIENSKRTNRKIKIGKIFSFDVYTEPFSPSKSISSRYSTKIINKNKYGTLPIKKDS